MSRATRRRFLQQTAAMGAIATTPGRSLVATVTAADFRPRFAICNETFGDWPFEKAFRLVAE